MNKENKISKKAITSQLFLIIFLFCSNLLMYQNGERVTNFTVFIAIVGIYYLLKPIIDEYNRKQLIKLKASVKLNKAILSDKIYNYYILVTRKYFNKVKNIFIWFMVIRTFINTILKNVNNLSLIFLKWKLNLNNHKVIKYLHELIILDKLLISGYILYSTEKTFLAKKNISKLLISYKNNIKKYNLQEALLKASKLNK